MTVFTATNTSAQQNIYSNLYAFISDISTAPNDGPIDNGESIDFNITQNGAVISTSSPVSINTSEPLDIIIYEVQEGDTLSSIAQQFNISINTIKWANNINGNTIKIGDKLEILPVSGIKYTVKNGDTVIALAKKYRSNANKIIDFNALATDGSLQIGDVLIIPDGMMPSISPLSGAVASTNYPSLSPGYFVLPIGSGHRSQGLHRFNAVDLASNCGTQILAAANGIVIGIKNTESKNRSANGGYGSYIDILHPNGVTTRYAHLLDILVTVGQNVNQGQVIALMGGQPRTPGAGKSTACHLHFEVRGAKNPFAYGPLAFLNNNL